MSDKVEAICFDLDGVLLDAKMIHFRAFNIALGVNAIGAISYDEHLKSYDGLPTRVKLQKMVDNKLINKLDDTDIERINKQKQYFTTQQLKEIEINDQLVSLFTTLRNHNIKIAVCSNSVRATIFMAMKSLGINDLVNFYLSNEDVAHSKPHPMMYWKAATKFYKYDIMPENIVIVEDSPNGIYAAKRSGMRYIRVDSTDDVLKPEFFETVLSGKINPPNKWSDRRMNVLIPMAGAGSRFATAGYTFPKPLIEVNGKPMIQVVVENIGIDANYIFVVQKEHREKYNLDTMLNIIASKCKIVEVDGLTEGAACTALLAKEYIDNDDPLFFANSDQWVKWNPVEFFYKMNETKSDGGIVTFNSIHPKWSYARIEDGDIVEVAEKNPISNNATVGFYFWKKGKDFVKYSEQMIEKNIRVNNEFYVCPVFNEAIQDGKIIKNFEAEEMRGLGTPEDLRFYLENHT